MNDDFYTTRAKLLGSPMLFTRTFYKILTGREFYISQPVGRESQHIITWRALKKVFDLEIPRLLINIPPGHHKSTMLSFWIPWCYAHYPDCNFIYTSVSHELAAKNTYLIKKIMMLPAYNHFFDVSISRDSSAKDNFSTTKGGFVTAFGADGTIVGANAGLPDVDRFSGALIMDDMHKPKEVFSDTIREGAIENYKITLSQRRRGNNVPFIFLGQRLHEADLPAHLIQGFDGYNWHKIILASPDAAGNALDPKVIDEKGLDIIRVTNPYVYNSQYLQDPTAAGGTIFSEDQFILMDERPKILATFLTVDTAETDKNYNDPTVFSFFGLYKIKHGEVETDILGLHWIDCLEDWINAADLETRFLDFYYGCARFSVPPSFVAIEKKSTGVTLSATLKKLPGLTIRDVERTKASGNKIARYMECVPFVNSGRVSLDSGGNLWKLQDNKMKNVCLEHMKKLTDNGAHARDDIADTFYDAVKIGLIDGLALPKNAYQESAIITEMAHHFNKQRNLRNQMYGRPAI